MNEKVRAEYAKLLKESAETKSEIKFHEDKIKTLEAKEKLLTKKGRNQFIFSLGLRAEAYFKEPEFLRDYDFDMIFTAAFGDPDVYDLIERTTEKRKAEYLAKAGKTAD